MTQTDRDTPVTALPRTEAGRRLFTDNEPMDMLESNGVTWSDVRAIEDEAIQRGAANTLAFIKETRDRDTPVTALREALEYAAGFMADPEGLAHRREEWLAKVNRALASSDDVAGSGERLVDITGVDAIRRAVVAEMENEGVVTWGDAGHRARFLAPTTEAPPKDAPVTASGRRDHDIAWTDGGQTPVDHDSERDGCYGCAFIARIEAEAATAARSEIDELREQLRRCEEAPYA